MKKPGFIIAAVCLLACGVCVAELGFAPIFNDGAVLQCEMPVNIWGKADPGAGVEIRLDGQKIANGMADASGDWKAAILEQDAGGAHVVEAVSGDEAIKISDVWFGEVWLT